jgi:hypothetical protein
MANIAALYDLRDGGSVTTTTAAFTATGTATCTIISTALTGSGTAFLNELGVGDTVLTLADVTIGTILSVTDNTNAVLTANASVAITGVGFHIVKANPRILLIADQSGADATVVLYANSSGSTAAGTRCTTPNVAANQALTELELVARIAMDSLATTTRTFFSKWNTTGNQRAWAAGQGASAGNLALTISGDGTATQTIDSSAAINSVFSDLQVFWVKINWRASDQRTQFWYHTDTGSNTEPASWTQLGTDVTMPGAIASLKNSTSTVCLIGSAGGFNAAWGNVYYASIRKAIGGSVDQAVDFSSFTKLATTGTDSIGATWTNNVPTAAFFKWPRDLTQGTESAQPLLVSSAAVFDGRNDVIFSRYYLPQPYTTMLPYFPSPTKVRPSTKCASG